MEGFKENKNTPISSDEIAVKIGTSYNINNVRCTYISRDTNDVYFVESDQGMFFFRVTLSGFKIVNKIETEVEVIINMTSKKQKVSRPVEDKNGEIIQKLENEKGIRFGVLWKDTLEDNVEKVYKFS